MKISYNWLKQYVDTKQSAEEVARLLTFSGLEVEGTEKTENIKGGLDKYYIGHVLTCEPHPNSDHLHITTVDVAGEKPLSIVCGAPNIAKGQKVVVATIGAMVYCDGESFAIKKSKLRGVESEGMICSQKELQLGNDHEGILVLPPEAKEGTPAHDYFDIKEDTIFEIGLTANRSDATSHIGVGRDLVAILSSQCKQETPLQIPDVSSFKVGKISEKPIVKIDEQLCGRYAGLTMSGVTVKDSPSWLAERLQSVGIRPINNIVDATNYVLMEIGQPLHAFDWDKVEGKTIEVKTVAKGTKFTTLDNIERELNGKEAMVCSKTEPMCMGGIFGGEFSSISNTTSNVFIESAYFNPVTIRKAARYHGLQTDASFRFERGADPNVVLYALKRVAILIEQISGGEVSSEIVDVYPHKIERASVEFQYDYLDKLIGQKIDRAEIEKILTHLDIEISHKDDQGLSLLIPTNKVDVTRPCDVAEEVLRIYGYDKIGFSSKIQSTINYIQKPDKEKVQNLIAAYLADNGFYETINNSLTRTAYYENNADFPIEKSVSLVNPLSRDLALMRQTLLYGGLSVLSHNLNRKVFDIKTFEFGNCYEKALSCPDDQPVDKRYKEEKHLSLFCTGNKSPESWQGKSEPIDFFYVKNIVLNLFKRLRVDFTCLKESETERGYMQQAMSLVNKDNGKELALIGILNPSTAKSFDIKQKVFYADVNWKNLLKVLPKTDLVYTAVSKYPEVRRDLALVLDEKIRFSEIESVAFDCEKKLLKSVNLFDEYRGEKIGNKKQYAVSFVLQDTTKTLTDKQIEAVMSKLVKAFETRLGAKLR